jgi:hypothetical protein
MASDNVTGLFSGKCVLVSGAPGLLLEIKMWTVTRSGDRNRGKLCRLLRSDGTDARVS